MRRNMLVTLIYARCFWLQEMSLKQRLMRGKTGDPSVQFKMKAKLFSLSGTKMISAAYQAQQEHNDTKIKGLIIV